MGKKKVICELAGGLGNQMFCYASGMAIAQKYDCDFKIDISRFANDKFGRKFELSNFNISAPIINLKRNNLANKLIRKARILPYKVITEDDCIFNDIENTRFDSDKIYLDYNWHQQNHRLFDSIYDDIVDEFAYKNSISSNFSSISEQLELFFTVSVHLRYGDYVKIGCCIDPRYYSEAIEKLLSRAKLMNISKEIAIVVFSEDTDAAMNIIRNAASNVKIIGIDRSYGLTDIEEFILMKNCDAQVISNSTFSWWAAYLSEKNNSLVAAPTIDGWIKNEWNSSYFPKDWITIKSELMHR